MSDFTLTTDDTALLREYLSKEEIERNKKERKK